MNEAGPPKNARRQRAAMWALVGAFAMWGTCVAIGSTGYFTDRGLFDVRRSLIVLGCTVVFLAFWCWVYFRPRGQTDPTGARTNWLSVASLLSVGGAYLAGGFAWLSDSHESEALPLTLSLISLGLMGLSALLAVIGLSDPRPRRLKLLGLATLGLLGLAVLALMVGSLFSPSTDGAERLSNATRDCPNTLVR